jgi:serine O-acetyltransferase
MIDQDYSKLRNPESAHPGSSCTHPATLNLLEEWREDVACAFDHDPAARTAFEVLTTYPGVHAVLGHRLSHRLWRRGLHYPARLLAFLIRFWSNIDIHPGAVIGRRFFINHGAGVVIRDDVKKR